MTDIETDPIETWVRREEAEWERQTEEERKWTPLGSIALTLFASLLLWAIIWLVVGGLSTVAIPALSSLIPPS